MRTEDKTHIQNSVGRLVISALSFLLQIWWIFFLAMRLQNYSTAISTVSSIVAMMVTIWLFNRSDTPSEFKMPWMILILAFPIAGVCIFLMYGHKRSTKKIRKRMEDLHNEYIDYVCQDQNILNELEEKDLGIANQFGYLSKIEKFPVFQDTKIKYFSDAKDAYEKLIRDAENAKRYIFLEYHAIEYGKSFKKLLNVLEKKAKNGVEIRILYDDVGSIGFLNSSFAKKMEACGIQCKAFNKVSPAFRLFMNNRDHRKIAVIDGEIGHTGGYNLADEYFHETSPYGFWYDSGVRIEGNAVRSLVGMFLEMWNGDRKNLEEDFFIYFNVLSQDMRYTSYIQPYADNPLDESRVGENVYLNMIKNAKKTLYVTTPYLIPGDVMIRELTMAKERGVDVRILTPGIPDKKVIYRVTRSYYNCLLKKGIRIYEYTPGFLHAKQMVADNEIAAVGTINMDYRSLRHHFENGILMYQTDAVNDVTNSMQALFAESKEVDANRHTERFVVLRMFDCVLRLLAPLF